VFGDAPDQNQFVVDGSFFIGISKSGFSFEIKAKQRINPQAYSSMSRT
jgi:hypothetical protein